MESPTCFQGRFARIKGESPFSKLYCKSKNVKVQMETKFCFKTSISKKGLYVILKTNLVKFSLAKSWSPKKKSSCSYEAQAPYVKKRNFEFL